MTSPETPGHSPVPEIVIPIHSFENWRGVFLRQIKIKTGIELTRIERISVSKDLFTDPDNKLAFLVINNLGNSSHVNQVQGQVDFYERFYQDPKFSSVVVPMEAKLTLLYGDLRINIGMVQNYYGIDIREYKALGGRLSIEAIEVFITKYRKLIDHTGYSHGDLITDPKIPPNVVLEHIRIGDEGPEFVDYYGYAGNIVMGPNVYSPGHKQYNTVRDQDPKLLRIALHNFFGV